MLHDHIQAVNTREIVYEGVLLDQWIEILPDNPAALPGVHFM